MFRDWRDARAGCCSEARKIRAEHRGGGALLAGDASGQRSRTAGTASGFLLCSGLAVAGPRAPVAYCISTGQCVGRRSCLSMLDGHAWKPYLNLGAWARRRSPEAARWLTSLLTTDQVPFSARWPTGHGGMACLVAFVQGHGHGGTETSESMEASVAVSLGPASGRRALTWQLY